MVAGEGGCDVGVRPVPVSECGFVDSVLDYFWFLFPVSFCHLPWLEQWLDFFFDG